MFEHNNILDLTYNNIYHVGGFNQDFDSMLVLGFAFVDFYFTKKLFYKK